MKTDGEEEKQTKEMKCEIYERTPNQSIYIVSFFFSLPLPCTSISTPVVVVVVGLLGM